MPPTMLLLHSIAIPFQFWHTQVVAEYERAVIFRLGRLRKGGSKGPGIFTVIPCIDTYRCVDLRTVSFDVPPQEVSINIVATSQPRAESIVLPSRFSPAIRWRSRSTPSFISMSLTRNRPYVVSMISGELRISGQPPPLKRGAGKSMYFCDILLYSAAFLPLRLYIFFRQRKADDIQQPREKTNLHWPD